MAFTVEQWKSEFAENGRQFAELWKTDQSVGIKNGVTAAAILWSVREMDRWELLAEVLPDRDHTALTDLLRLWHDNDFSRQQAAKSLSRRASGDTALQELVTALIVHFIDDLLAVGMLQPDMRSVEIRGDVSGGIVNIGGMQYFAGDVIVQQITQQRIRACPTAPKPPAHFAGRRDELTRLQQVLSQGQSVAITGIQGIGGIGKTALALQLASEMPEFSAVLWASLGPNPNTALTLIEWARHADPDFDPQQDDVDTLVYRVQALLTNLIQEQCPGRVLVILDDIWEGDSVRAARTLQKAAPSNSVSLITTRSERVVAQLRSTNLKLLPMTPDDALKMLRNLLSDYPNLTDDSLLDLAESVGHHPLAMELAAGQVRLLERPEREIGEQIERYRGGIPAGSPFRDIGLELGEDREDNLEVVLAYSYDSLSEQEQAYFRALGVLAYNVPFDRELCEAIWATEPKEVLDGLRHRAMLAIAENEGWYQQHVLLRSYARALVRTEHEYDPVFFRYVDHMIAFAEQFRRLPLERWKILEPKLPHLQTAGDELVIRYDTATTSDLMLSSRTVNLIWNTMSYLYHRPSALFVVEREAQIMKRIAWFAAGIDACHDNAKKATILNYMGMVYAGLGDKDKALTAYQHALPLRRQVGDKTGEAVTLANMGAVCESVDKNDEALVFYQRALTILRRSGSKSHMATMLNNIGIVYSHLDDHDKALDYYQQALSLRQRLADKHGEAVTLHNLGSLYSSLDNKRQAWEYYQQALLLRRLVSDTGGEATTFNRRAHIYRSSGKSQHAMRYYQESLALNQSIGDKAGEAASLHGMGGVYADLGDKDQALAYYMQALALVREVGSKQGEASALNNIGLVYADLGDKDQALSYYIKALSLYRWIGDRRGQAVALHSMGQVYSSLRNPKQALTCYQQELTLRQSVGDKRRESITLSSMAAMYRLLRNNENALKAYQEALLLQRKIRDKRGVAKTLTYLGMVYFDLEEKEKALDFFQKALPLQHRVGNRRGIATTLIGIGMVYEDIQQEKQALAAYNQALSIQLELGEIRAAVTTLTFIALVYENLGDKEKALATYKKILNLQIDTGETRVKPITLTLCAIGRLYSSLGDRVNALDYYQQALPIHLGMGDKEGEAATCFNIGMVYFDLGDFEQAIQYVEHSTILSDQLHLTNFESRHRALEQLKQLRASATLREHPDQ